MAQWLGRAIQSMKCSVHDPELMGLRPGGDKLRVA